jgi:hypothetical protein
MVMEPRETKDKKEPQALKVPQDLRDLKAT